MRVVRDITKVFGCNVIYTREGGYFQKDEFDGEEWEFGRDYLGMQLLYLRLEKGELPSREEMIKVVGAYCGLMHRAAYLRAMYNSAMDVIDGRAEFRE